MGNGPSRAAIIRTLEDRAEQLTADQLDLIAQIESQLRAVHHTMRRIETLRSARSRVGPELSNGERRVMLQELAAEVASIVAQLDVQLDTCQEMQKTIRRMQGAAAELQNVTEPGRTGDESSAEA